MMSNKQVFLFVAVILLIAFSFNFGRECDEALGPCEYNAPHY